MNNTVIQLLKGVYIIAFIFLLVAIDACNPRGAGVNKNDISVKDELDKVKIEYLAHASFLLTYQDHTLLLDPFADSVWISYSFPRNIEADAIFSTHPHYDHDGGIFRDLHPYWQGKIPFYQDPGEYTIGSFQIKGLKGKHCDPYGKEFGQRNTIFIFNVGGLRIAHWGDNGPITGELAEGLTEIDILMLPIDDSYHILKAEELAEVIETIQPKVIIPMHYRINELEPTAGKPKNLGALDEYLANNENVIRKKSNVVELNPVLLPTQMEYWVFRHSPDVK